MVIVAAGGARAQAAMKLRETKEGLGASQPEMKTMEQH